MTLVDYLVARDGVPSRRGLAYDYVLAGDGLWLAAENEALAVRAPVARCAVRGLPPLGGACVLKHGPIPTWIWCAGVGIAAAMAAAGVEVALLVAVDGAGRYALIIPEQAATPTRVRYRAPALPPDTTIALTLHSHHRLPAYFSATDDGDERGLGLYGVLGRLGTPRPEVALRAGAYGHWLPVRWEAVFAGGRDPFRDAPFDPPDPADGADDPTGDPDGKEVGGRWPT
ncbi:MAG TPA: Mov34/MPN/PAD-1 family protein [Thermomicrobiales bacterium]|nr:Mov34/MPN/PAD-1 family protein [Thermomicrobiales bacterium]